MNLFLYPHFLFKIRDSQCFSSSKHRFDVGYIRQPQDAISLFQKLIPCVVDFTKLVDALEKMKQHSVAYALNIPIDCFCFVNRVDFAFSVLGSLVKRCYKLNIATTIALVKGLFFEGKVEAEEFLVKLVILCELNEMKLLILLWSICQKWHTICSRKAKEKLDFLD